MSAEAGVTPDLLSRAVENVRIRRDKAIAEAAQLETTRRLILHYADAPLDAPLPDMPPASSGLFDGTAVEGMLARILERLDAFQMTAAHPAPAVPEPAATPPARPPAPTVPERRPAPVVPGRREDATRTLPSRQVPPKPASGGGDLLRDAVANVLGIARKPLSEEEILEDAQVENILNSENKSKPARVVRIRDALSKGETDGDWRSQVAEGRKVYGLPREPQARSA